MINKYLSITLLFSLMLSTGCDNEDRSAAINSRTVQTQAKAAFEKCTQTVFSISDISKPFPSVNQIEGLSQSVDGALSFQSTGKDPHMHLPATLGKSLYLVKIAVMAPTKTTFEFFYKNEKGNYNGDQLILYPIKKGENTFFLKVEDENAISAIRIDPGKTSGQYTLNEFSIRTL